MGYEIHIDRINLKAKKTIPINKEEWKDCCQTISNLKINTQNSPNSIETFIEKINDWHPIFWINGDSGAMKSRGFFEYEETFQKATEIAQYLGAIISGDAHEVYFIPNYGKINDPRDSKYSKELNLKDLIDLEIDLTGNFQKELDAFFENKK